MAVPRGGDAARLSPNATCELLWYATHVLRVALPLLLSLLPTIAAADLLPEPERPPEWQQHAPPQPPAPPEKDLTPLLWSLPLLLALFGVWSIRHSLTEMRQR